MKLIPTPQSFLHAEEYAPIVGFADIQCKVSMDETISWGLAKLQESLTNSGTDVLVLENADDAFFSEKNAKEQGYILIRDAKCITLKAQTSIGFLYGLMTLRQLCEEAPVTFTIYDRPQIRFRGNMNTLWAESGIWSYDFGDGLESAVHRLQVAIDEAAMFKLNMMYIDAFGYATDRFPGYNEAIRGLSEYGKVRGVRMMVGGYGMGYGQSAHSNTHKGKVYRNRFPYPDGELYDCIGTYDYSDLIKNAGPEVMRGRSFGTCLSNTALTDDKVSEILEYVRATGVNMIYMHNMDADQLHEPLWLGRCDHCRKKYPNDDLYARDGAAGAFADFYDQMLDTLLPECPELIILPVSPGYCYATSTEDFAFEKARKFWANVKKFCRHKENLIPTFRELFHQHEEPKLRYELLNESIDTFGSVYFSSGDGFYSDKCYTPSAAYSVTMRDADLMICANGGALQKATALTNAEYLWNTDNSAFWNLDIPADYKAVMPHYNAFREGYIRPEGIYGEDGLLDTSCCRLFGKAHGKRIADVFRIRGKNGECPIFTACNVEIWTRGTFVNFPMLWDTPQDLDKQNQFRERFAESTIATLTAKDILAEVLEADDLDAETRAHLSFLHESAANYAKLCSQLTRYMDLYMEADRYFENGEAYNEDIYARIHALVQDANTALAQVQNDGRKVFDTTGGVLFRREALFDFVAYSAGQIAKSLQTNQRVPEDRRALVARNWW